VPLDCHCNRSVFRLSTRSDVLPAVSADISTVGPYPNLVYPNDELQRALLVQRDIALDLPISAVILPGINLTSSWFWANEYTVANITDLSDLFDFGYRRFELDLWFDNMTSSFQLCPEQIVSNSTLNTTRIVTTTLIQAVTETTSSTTRTFDRTVTSMLTSTPSSSAAIDPSNPIALANGYSCAPGADLSAVIKTVQSLLSRTDTLLRQAGIVLLILNLHTLPSLANNTTFDLSASSPNSLSFQMNATMADWLYTPPVLASQRQNLNATFFASNPETDVFAYYDLTMDNITQIVSTENGWPSTRYLFQQDGRRLLIGFGDVDVSTDTYDITQDYSIIFPPGTFGSQRQVVPSTSIQNNEATCNGPAGGVFGPSGTIDFNSSSLSGNYTWAISSDPSPSDPLSYDTIESLVSCGLSPLIDSPLQNTNSGISSPFDPISATMWSWLPPSEPKNTSLPMNGTANVVACAALESDSGRWVVLDCNTELSVACRINNQISSVTPFVEISNDIVANWAGEQLFSSLDRLSTRLRLQRP
jgi:hypothetical protein